MSDEYITIRQAQDRLQRSERMVRNYAAKGRVRTQQRAGRVLYHSEDINQLLTEIRPEAPAPITDILPAGELMNHIRDLEIRLQQASAEVGYLRGVLEAKNLELTDTQNVRKQLSDREVETTVLQQQITQAQQHIQEIVGSNNTRGRLITILLVLLVIALVGIIVVAIFR